jgi:predicted acylesterase/phospholipase RssA
MAQAADRGTRVPLSWSEVAGAELAPGRSEARPGARAEPPVASAPPREFPAGRRPDLDAVPARSPDRDGARDPLSLDDEALTAAYGELPPELVLKVPAPQPAITRAAPVALAPIGLALSGGGIRSATFCLGVLQSLAKKGRLGAFDYLSTVSGGGYIGSWLSAWIHRSDLQTVQRELARTTGAGEPAEVTWLRRYSNYLAPRLGLFSLDSLTLAATWLRNCALNLVVILSFLGALFLLPLLLAGALAQAPVGEPLLGYAAVVAGQLFLAGIGFNLYHQSLDVRQTRNLMTSPQGVYATVMLPGMIAATLAALWFFPWPKDRADVGEVLWIATAGALVVLVGWLAVCLLQRAFGSTEDAAAEPSAVFIGRIARETGVYVLAGIAAILAGGGTLIALYAGWHKLVAADPALLQPVLLTLAGPPALLLVFAVASTVFTGLVGRVYAERSREWWSRMNAGYLFIAGAWLAVAALSFFALPLLVWAGAQLGAWSAALGGGWLGTLLVSLLGGKPAATAGKPARALRMQQLVNVAAGVFVVGLLLVTAAATSWAVQRAAGIDVVEATPAGSALPLPAGYRIESEAPVAAGSLLLEHARHLDALVTRRPLCQAPGCAQLEASPAFAGFCLLMALLLVFSWRVDINKFSLHNMYKNRLVRCYLGASRRANRNASPFIGLDDKDDLALARLGSTPDLPPQRPFHILNAARNISQGAELAWQERKAASFVFTPAYCGYAFGGVQGESTREARAPDARSDAYRSTATYGVEDEHKEGITLGMAMTTSGAAVSPNQGRATSPALAFVLTVFNARLGRWSPNPAEGGRLPPSPRIGLIALLQELFGYSNERRRYVYLSDGGHFDNLGLYELVRRRCTLVLAVDASGDPDRKFDDLAEAVRKCRVDLGTRIEFDDDAPLRAQPPHTLAEAGYLVGRILYPDQPPGVLIYLKPTLCRDAREPVDVRTYAAVNPRFPHQTTVDQFFDESQFEAYRQLGEHQGDRCLEAEGRRLPVKDPPARPLAHDQSAGDLKPGAATRLLGRLLRWPRAAEGSALPSRDGSLVDYFAIGLAASVLGAVLFQLADWLWLAPSGFCFSAATCVATAEPMYAAARQTLAAERLLFWRTLAIDGLFVLVYCVTLGQGYWIAAMQIVRGRAWGGPAKFALFAVLMTAVGTMAVADYAENVRLLAALATEMSAQQIAQAVAPFTAIKFRLFAVLSFVLLVLGLIAIWPAWRARWAKGTGS